MTITPARPPTAGPTRPVAASLTSHLCEEDGSAKMLLANDFCNTDFYNAILAARERWLKPEEVQALIADFHGLPEVFNWPTKPARNPPSGSLFVFDRTFCASFRNDGYKGKESHSKLKVGGESNINCYYFRSSASDGEEATSGSTDEVKRRIYWLLDNDRIVLVHYRKEPKEEDGSDLENGSPVNAGAAPQVAPQANDQKAQAGKQAPSLGSPPSLQMPIILPHGAPIPQPRQAHQMEQQVQQSVHQANGQASRPSQQDASPSRSRQTSPPRTTIFDQLFKGLEVLQSDKQKLETENQKLKTEMAAKDNIIKGMVDEMNRLKGENKRKAHQAGLAQQRRKDKTACTSDRIKDAMDICNALPNLIKEIAERHAAENADDEEEDNAPADEHEEQE